MAQLLGYLDHVAALCDQEGREGVPQRGEA